MDKYSYIQTVDEIIYQDGTGGGGRFFSDKPNIYKVGEKVEFIFSGRKLRGRITNALYKGGKCTYHIETSTGTWFRGIPQVSITRRIPVHGTGDL